MASESTGMAATVASGTDIPAPAEQPCIADETILRNTGASVREEAEDDGRHLLYEPNQELLLLINGSGRAILELCDGRRTVGAVVAELESRYDPRDGVDLRGEVLRFLRTLRDTGLVMMIEAPQ